MSEVTVPSIAKKLIAAMREAVVDASALQEAIRDAAALFRGPGPHDEDWCAAVDTWLARHAPVAPPAPPEQPKGEALGPAWASGLPHDVCLCNEGDQTFHAHYTDNKKCARCKCAMFRRANPPASTPAQDATEVTHEQARDSLRRFSLRNLPGWQTRHADVVERYIDQQSRRERDYEEAHRRIEHPRSWSQRQCEAFDEGHRAGFAAGQASMRRDADPVWAKLDALAHKFSDAADVVEAKAAAAQVPQAAPRVEDDPLWAVKWATAFLQGPDGSVPTKPFDALVAKLHDVASEARAAALRAGAVEALREWQQLHRERQLRVLESVGDISAEAFALLDALAVAGKGA